MTAKKHLAVFCPVRVPMPDESARLETPQRNYLTLNAADPEELAQLSAALRVPPSDRGQIQE